MTINQAIIDFIEKHKIKLEDLAPHLGYKGGRQSVWQALNKNKNIKEVELSKWVIALTRASGQSGHYVEHYLRNMISTDLGKAVNYSLPDHTSELTEPELEYESNNIHLLQLKIQELTIIKDALLKELRAKEKMIRDFEKRELRLMDDIDELKRDKNDLRARLQKYERDGNTKTG